MIQKISRRIESKRHLWDSSARSALASIAEQFWRETADYASADAPSPTSGAENPINAPSARSRGAHLGAILSSSMVLWMRQPMILRRKVVAR